MAACGGGTRARSGLGVRSRVDTSVHWSVETRRRLRARRRRGVAAFLLIVTALILVRAPEASLEGLLRAAHDSWLPAVALGMFLTTLAVDILTCAPDWLGVAHSYLDVRFDAGLEGGGPPVFYSRRAKGPVAYPAAIIATFAFLRFADAPACS